MGLLHLRRIPATASLLPLLSFLSDGSRARPSEVGGATAARAREAGAGPVAAIAGEAGGASCCR